VDVAQDPAYIILQSTTTRSAVAANTCLLVSGPRPPCVLFSVVWAVGHSLCCTVALAYHPPHQGAVDSHGLKAIYDAAQAFKTNGAPLAFSYRCPKLCRWQRASRHSGGHTKTGGNFEDAAMHVSRVPDKRNKTHFFVVLQHKFQGHRNGATRWLTF
jgi:hypothetical protein